jgi:hypothetical protein
MSRTCFPGRPRGFPECWAPCHSPETCGFLGTLYCPNVLLPTGRLGGQALPDSAAQVFLHCSMTRRFHPASHTPSQIGAQRRPRKLAPLPISRIFALPKRTANRARSGRRQHPGAVQGAPAHAGAMRAIQLDASVRTRTVRIRDGRHAEIRLECQQLSAVGDCLVGDNLSAIRDLSAF